MSRPEVSHRERRRDIQGFRAIAVLIVVIFHAGLPLHGGFVGVDVFFAISGFVIGSALLAELERSSHLRFGEFYARRVRRLLPALTVVLVVTMLAAALFASPLGPQTAIANTGGAASLFGANVQLFRSPAGYFDISAEANALLHTWSLSVEEQFYLVFPALLLLAWRFERPGHRTRLVLGVIAIVALSFALSAATTFDHGQHLAHALGGTAARFAFYLPVTRVWEFAIGVLVALSSPWLRQLPRSATNVIGVVGISMVLVGACWIGEVAPFPGTLALIPVIGAAAVIAAGHDVGSIVSRGLKFPPLVWIGDISYGWYLWHWPLIVYAKALWPGANLLVVVAAAFSVVPAALSYRWIETPLRRDTRIVGLRALCLGLACIAAGVGTSYALRAITTAEQSTDTIQQLADSLRGHADELRLCNGGETEAIPTRCTWPVDHAKGTIILIGDSNAGHFTEVVARTANETGYELEVTTMPGCPFADLYASSPRHSVAACRAFIERASRMLLRRRPALVIVGTASTTYLASPAVGLRFGNADRETHDRAEKLRVWELGVHGVVQPLGAAGIPVLWIHAVPRITDLSPTSCPYLVAREGGDACSVQIARELVDEDATPANVREVRALRDVPLATTVDLTDALCSEATCAARRGGLWIFRDDGHLTVDGGLSLAPRFRSLIAEHAR